MENKARKEQINHLKTLCKNNNIVFEEYWPEEGCKDCSEDKFAFSRKIIELACFYKQRSQKEWQLLKRRLAKLEQSTDSFDKGVVMLYKSVLPLETDIEADVDKQIKEAGEHIYKSKGNIGMRDMSVLQFLPIIVKPIVNAAWDGIGDWKY